MFRIEKTFRFSAAHSLSGPVTHDLPEHDPCRRVHGHNYQVIVLLQAATLNENGMVRNFHDLAPFGAYLGGCFDHTNLDDHPVFQDVPTTSEALARHLYVWAHERWSEVIAVRVSETPTMWVEYSEPVALPPAAPTSTFSFTTAPESPLFLPSGAR